MRDVQMKTRKFNRRILDKLREYVRGREGVSLKE